MAKHRTPSNILDARGSFRKNPQRARADATDARPLGDPPMHLSEAQLAAWLEIVADAIPGLLNAADRVSVEIAAVTLAKIRDGSAIGGDYRLLANLLGRFGMTPADRSRVSAPQPKAKRNEFADL